MTRKVGKLIPAVIGLFDLVTQFKMLVVSTFYVCIGCQASSHSRQSMIVGLAIRPLYFDSAQHRSSPRLRR